MLVHSVSCQFPISVMAWGTTQDASSKHPIYTLVSGSQNGVSIQKLSFDIASMSYHLSTKPVMMPNSGLKRTYTFGLCNDEMFFAGTTSGDVCIFNIKSALFKATMPMTTHGCLSGIIYGDTFFVGGGDGKVKRVALTDGEWTLTHEAQLEGRVCSIDLSSDKQELLCATSNGQIYRVLTDELSFVKLDQNTLVASWIETTCNSNWIIEKETC